MLRRIVLCNLQYDRHAHFSSNYENSRQRLTSTKVGRYCKSMGGDTSWKRLNAHQVCNSDHERYVSETRLDSSGVGQTSYTVSTPPRNSTSIFFLFVVDSRTRRDTILDTPPAFAETNQEVCEKRKENVARRQRRAQWSSSLFARIDAQHLRGSGSLAADEHTPRPDARSRTASLSDPDSVTSGMDGPPPASEDPFIRE